MIIRFYYRPIIKLLQVNQYYLTFLVEILSTASRSFDSHNSVAQELRMFCNFGPLQGLLVPACLAQGLGSLNCILIPVLVSCSSFGPNFIVCILGTFLLFRCTTLVRL